MPKVDVSKSNIVGAPRWLADDISNSILPMPAKVDPTLFPDALAVKVVSTGVVAIGGTAIPVSTALSGPIPKGAVLDFGGGKFARTTADVAAGAVSIPVAAIPTALAANDTAYYSKYGRKSLPGGTLIGRTFAERNASTPYGPAVDTDDEIFLTVFDVADLESKDNEVELTRHQAVIKENYLPDWATISANANLLAKLRALYQTETGVD